jgi:hypothetical protein
MVSIYSLRVRANINLQILSIAATAWQGAKAQEYQAYSEAFATPPGRMQRCLKCEVILERAPNAGVFALSTEGGR